MDNIYEIYLIYFPIEQKYLNSTQPKDAVSMTKSVTQAKMYHSKSHIANQLKVLREKGYKGFVEIKTILNY